MLYNAIDLVDKKYSKKHSYLLINELLHKTFSYSKGVQDTCRFVHDSTK